MLNAEDTPEPQHKLYPPDHQPVIIEQYRGPLLEQQPTMKDTKAAIPTYEGEYPLRDRHYWLRSSRWQPIYRSIAAPFYRVAGAFHSGDQALNLAKRGWGYALLMIVSAFVLLLTFFISLLVYSVNQLNSVIVNIALLPIFAILAITMILITFSPCFIVLGMIDSVKALYHMRRSSQRRRTLQFALVGLALNGAMIASIVFVLWSFFAAISHRWPPM